MKIVAGNEINQLTKVTTFTHSCGYKLTKIDQPEMYDVTALGDVPEHLRGISFQDLPMAYHQFIQVGTITSFYPATIIDQHREVLYCPQCGERIEEQS
jgi:hypothetical protein